ncbi:regulatory protein RecX [Pullulanibacillus camelliae]|uniref:Regulatory protein RecX n=1 Tax=Pullulanibacillus camelliae TaxID=1707096 RepID=A0A8J3DVT6_9BACL|nr:recombination regulator RecX [Pullulanibacillus camelliae]GGE45478.1 regulatory protein RecX [Pullulanibacillus camelliae]
MITIDKISVHPKQKGYYILEFTKAEESQAMTIHEDLLVKHGLRKDLELSEKEFQQLVKLQEVNKIYLLAINYLSYRMRTEKELRDYLIKKEAVEPGISEVIQRLKEEKLVDDKQFAELFVRSRKRQSTKGPRLIAQELKNKGVSDSDMAPALQAYSFNEQYGNALRFAGQRSRAKDKLSNLEKKNKIGQSLMQKGFEAAVVQEVLNDLNSIKGENEEWVALCRQAEKAAHKYRQLEDRERNFKVKQFLYRKGFPSDLIARYIEGYDG